MINSKTPKSAVVERIGSDSAVFTQQLCAVAQGIVIKSDTGDDYWQLPIARKEVAMPTSASYALRLLEPKADFLRSNVSLLPNPTLSKKFPGESK